MKSLAALAAAACLTASAVVAQAATISSPALPTLHATDFEGGNLFNTTGACYVRNVGKTPAGVNVKFFQNFGVELASSFQNCNQAPLPPGRTCVALINDLPDDVVFSCSATIAGSAKNIRASIEQRGITVNGLEVLLAEELR